MPPIEGEYEPSPAAWVRDQVEKYERTGGREGNMLMQTDWPVVIITMRGKKSGKVRKTALMRVEHDGEYALVASVGGSSHHPKWYFNFKADPNIMIQDGPEPHDFTVRELEGEERTLWWDRAVAAYPPYAEYQTRTTRVIPVFLAQRKG